MAQNDSYYVLEPDPSGQWGNFLKLSPIWIGVVAFLALVVFLISGIMYVPQQKMAIVIKKTGKDLPQQEMGTQILALEEDQKGIKLEPVPEGLYFKNPFTWDWEIKDQVEVPSGKLGVQVRLFGNPLKEWQVIAKEGQKGILKKVLKPGRYLINPYAYRVFLMDAVTVDPGHRGVVWNVAGDMPKKTHRFLVAEGERGIMASTLEAGTYYVNPFVKRIISVDMRSHRFDTKKEEPIRFPSKDGFEISMDVIIEWAIDPNRLAEVYVKYVDLRGKDPEKLRQQWQKMVKKQKGGSWSFFRKKRRKSQKTMLLPTSPDVIDCIVEKIILPNVRSFTRLEGSTYDAVSFIRGEERIRFQNSFEKELKKGCAREGILIRSALVRNVSPPEEIAKPIREREIAIRNADKYKKEMERERQEKELARERKLQERNQLVTQSLADQDVAKIDANKKQQVALTNIRQKLEVAKKNYQAAKDQALAKVTKGKAKAYVIKKKNKAEAAGLRESSQSFGGGQQYVLYLFNKKIAPSIGYILSNTQGPFMKIFDKVLEKNTDKDFVPDESKEENLKVEKTEKKKENEKNSEKDK